MTRYLICVWVLFALGAKAQYVQNGDCEIGKVGRGSVPTGWHWCYKSPDLLPIPNIVSNLTCWNFYLPTGKYISLGISRESTFFYEALGQQLSKPIEKDSVYELGVDLSQIYNISDTCGGKSSFCSGLYCAVKPLYLSVYFGSDSCTKDFLALRSMDVTNYNGNFQRFYFRFTPDSNYQYIRLESDAEHDNSNAQSILQLDNIALYKLSDKPLGLEDGRVYTARGRKLYIVE